MRNLETADQIYTMAIKMRQTFMAQKKQWTMQRHIDSLTWNDSLSILGKLNALLHSLPDFPVFFDERVEQLRSCRIEENEETVQRTCMAVFEETISDILLEIIKYRRYYCVIRRNDMVPGLASHIMTNLGQIFKSIQAGYIPVIDTCEVNNFFAPISREYNQNAWEMYFRQPFGIGLSGVREAEKINIADGIPNMMPHYHMEWLTNPLLMNMWRKMQRKYMPLSDDMKAAIASAEKKCFGSKKISKVMGVLCRGTDYTNLHPYNHPVQPSPQRMLEFVAEQMQKQECSHCYLATEDQSILELFQKELGGALLYSQVNYYDEKVSVLLNEYNGKDAVKAHEKNVEYLTALYLLALCDCFVGGRTSGSVVTLLFADDFSYTHIWNEGRYGIDEEQILDSYLI